MEKKIKIRLTDTYRNKEYYLLLKENEFAFLKWLFNTGIIDEDNAEYATFNEMNLIEF